MAELYQFRDGTLHRKLCHTGTDHSNYRNLQQNESGKSVLLTGSMHCSSLKVLTQEDENGNVKLECPAISKQQFAAGSFVNEF
ncbi:hypothetical protein Bca52824_052243 [Brassica carinata]|uniref:Uncharacterized protein n=1 Tax=Brassica carinata TaxID=52824 RepID=A0A8X7R4C1_BRACI|nr:hypothetical protein Bca52824_052243 [Brassica carinata]